jgi:hypothetical protein
MVALYGPSTIAKVPANAADVFLRRAVQKSNEDTVSAKVEDVRHWSARAVSYSYMSRQENKYGTRPFHSPPFTAKLRAAVQEVDCSAMKQYLFRERSWHAFVVGRPAKVEGKCATEIVMVKLPINESEGGRITID